MRKKWNIADRGETSFELFPNLLSLSFPGEAMSQIEENLFLPCFYIFITRICFINYTQYCFVNIFKFHVSKHMDLFCNLSFSFSVVLPGSSLFHFTPFGSLLWNHETMYSSFYWQTFESFPTFHYNQPPLHGIGISQATMLVCQLYPRDFNLCRWLKMTWRG